MRKLFLDFECYYDTHYSLKKMATSAYVRDPLFKIHGCALKWDSNETHWYSEGELTHILNHIDWDDVCVIAHHAHFDGFILSEIYGIHPAKFSCTLSISRAVHQGICKNDLDSIGIFRGYGGKIEGLEATKGKRELTHEELTNLATYCVNDVNKMYQFYIDVHDLLPPDEHELIDLTIKMFTNPVLHVDYERAREELEREIAHKEALIEASGTTKEILSSNKQFAAYLESLGVQVPTKINAKGKKTFAFAKDDIEFMNLITVPELRPIIQARLAVKSTITETRAARLIDHCPPDGALPIYLKYWGAHTGRWSGGDKLNPQNFTRGGELRKSIIAAMGFVLVVIDLSQIEARMLAWWANCTQLLEAFAQGRDIYSEFAGTIFGYPVNRKTKYIDEAGNEVYPQFAEGFVGKVCILGLGYGMGAPKFRYTLASGGMGATVDLPKGLEFKTVSLYRNTYREIPALWRECGNMLGIMGRPRGTSSMFTSITPIEREINGVKFTRDEHGGIVTLPTGRKLLYPDLWMNDKGDYVYREGNEWKKIYGGLLVENIVQAMARDVIAKQMLQINERYKIVLSTHDECVYLVPSNEAKAAYDWGMNIMTTVPDWCPGLPLEAEGGWAREYSK